MTAPRYCSFQLGDLRFGIDIVRVQEVIRAQRLTTVPLADPVVAGLLNLRGRVVTALDLRRRLDLAAAPEDLTPINIIVRTARGEVSLLADRIGDVVDVDPSGVEPLPETLRGIVRDLATGAYELDGRLLLLLDLDRVLDLPVAPAHRTPVTRPAQRP